MRSACIETLQKEVFDLAVIGGGITGAGIAQDASARGLKVALVEKKDFASGTSSRSSKLIHGGLRYLKQYNLRLTREACLERGLLRKLAPNLVKPSPFLIPIYLGRDSAWMLSLGLWIYDRIAPASNFNKHKGISKEEMARLAPMVRQKNLKGGLVYYDAITDDARLTWTVIKSALGFGAVAANYVQVVGLMKSAAKVCGVAVRDLISGKEFDVRARYVVNASGVWSDEVCAFDDEKREKMIRPSKGVHLVVPKEKLNHDTAYLIPSARDKRLLFVIPWGSVTVVGTTDTLYDGDIDDPSVQDEDVDYILDGVGYTFETDLSRKDIISTYAGLRPLIQQGNRSTYDLSRQHKIFESPSGLITIAGGKLTTYRKMACDVVDLVLKKLSGKGKCTTHRITLGSMPYEDRKWQPELDPKTLAHLQQAYGEDLTGVLEMVRSDPALGRKIIPELPYIRAEILYAVRNEMAVTIEDFLARRTRIMLEDKSNGLSGMHQVGHLMAGELGWDECELAKQIETYTTEAQRHRIPQPS